VSAPKIAVSIPDHVFTHPAYRALQPVERVLLDELLYVARRLGTDEPIIFSADMAANGANVKRSVAARALLGLRKKGFIVCLKSGDRRSGAKGRKATEWRLTFLPYQGEPPTLDYRAAHYKVLPPDLDPNEKFLTPELEERTMPPRASLSNAPHQSDDEVRQAGIASWAQPAPFLVSPQRDKCSQVIENIEVEWGSHLSRQRDTAFVPPAGQIEPATSDAELIWATTANPPSNALARAVRVLH
jgi:hypothetical protein